jgi:hypothetical protein
LSQLEDLTMLRGQSSQTVAERVGGLTGRHEPIRARRMGVWLHLMMCRHCRRFRRQLLRLGRIARLIADEFEREPTPGFEGQILDRLGS